MSSKIGIVGKIAVLTGAMAMLTGAQGPANDFQSRLLAGHNRERSLHRVPTLRWDDRLAEGAKAWAEHLARSGRFEHSPNRPGQPLEGENIWGGTRGAFGPESMIGLWVAEKRYFKPGRFPDNSTTGRVADVSHFTQVIWNDTRKVGCGLAQGKTRDILVCRYSNPGNVLGRRALRASF